jgi:uncharacterized protein YjbJ (UPF0337 family)
MSFPSAFPGGVATVKDKIEGKAEELKGKVTGDRGTELKGKARQAVGEAKRLARDLGVETSGRREAETPDEPEIIEREEPRPARPTDP